MATNKELVEQAVGAIPKWMDFLNQKEAEQNLILEQMQEEETQFAPKTFTERLTDRFKAAPQTPSGLDQASDQEDDSGIMPEQNQVKLEKVKLEEEPVEEEDDVEETQVEDVSGSQESASSNDGDRLKISNEDFKDIF